MAVAGFSVGELTALIFTGAITFSEGISLVKIRGEAMQVGLTLGFVRLEREDFESRYCIHNISPITYKKAPFMSKPVQATLLL
jgi:hypothetical protein